MKKNRAPNLTLVVKVMDDLLGPGEVQITPRGIFCSLCDHTRMTLTKNNEVLRFEGPTISGDPIRCSHIRYALSQPEVIERIKQKQKEGWKIELPTINCSSYDSLTFKRM